MDNPVLPGTSAEQEAWSVEKMVASKQEKPVRFLDWWVKFSALPEPPANASYIKREAARRSRLLSVVLFFFLPVIALAIPATTYMPDHLVFYVAIGAFCSGLIALFLNRAGHVTAGGLLLTLGFSAAIVGNILTTRPFDEVSLTLYDLYIIPELFAVSLLPAWTVFVFASCNSAFIWLDLVYQTHTPELGKQLAIQFFPILLRPIALQVLVAGVAFLWVTSATGAVRRAYRAEMVATLEHSVAEQRAISEVEKRQLEEGIRQIVNQHTEATNNHQVARLSYPEARLLWPLVGVINALWLRLQHAQQTEQALDQLKRALASYNEQIRQRVQSPHLPLPFYHTGTELDPLILSNKNLQDAVINQVKNQSH